MLSIERSQLMTVLSNHWSSSSRNGWECSGSAYVTSDSTRADALAHEATPEQVSLAVRRCGVDQHNSVAVLVAGVSIPPVVASTDEPNIKGGVMFDICGHEQSVVATEYTLRY